MNKPQQGLTYGKMVLIMLALVVLFVGAAFIRQFFVGPAIGFNDVAFAYVRDADYSQNESQLDTPTLNLSRAVTANSIGTMLFIKTNEGNFAKLNAEFNKCLIDPQNLKFWIHQGVVYNPNGQVINRLDNACIDLGQKFDLDTGQSEADGAAEGSADLTFVYRNVGLQILQAANNATMRIPSATDLESVN